MSSLVKVNSMVNSRILVISVLVKTSSVVKISIMLNATALIKASSVLVLSMLVSSLIETSNMLKTSLLVKSLVETSNMLETSKLGNNLVETGNMLKTSMFRIIILVQGMAMTRRRSCCLVRSLGGSSAMVNNDGMVRTNLVRTNLANSVVRTNSMVRDSVMMVASSTVKHRLVCAPTCLIIASRTDVCLEASIV